MVRSAPIDSSEDCGPLACLDVAGDVGGMDKLRREAAQHRRGPDTCYAPHLRRHDVGRARGEDNRWAAAFFLGEGTVGATTGSEVDDAEVIGKIRDASGGADRAIAAACALFFFSISLTTIAAMSAKMAFMSSTPVLISLRVALMALKFSTAEAMVLALIPSCYDP